MNRNIQTAKQKWQNSQYTHFSQKWDDKWHRHFPDKDDLKNKILRLEYDKFYDINNAFSKLNKALQICEFLHKLTKAKPPQDTEKIRITILVSCAEAVYKINKPHETICKNLVKGFFKSVKSKIDYKIKGYIGEMPYRKVFGPTEVLYLVRNDYIHNGNFTGVFFRNSAAESHVENRGSFYYLEKEDKTKLIKVFSDCSLTYQEFLTIFLEAFIKNIEKYYNKK